ncbi:MAG TPA: ABC transporter substrate-binding protein [Candidatus Limnocylindrales bacterium]|jgi:NitT/TauT family transport system substrate-binding protein|nr:ABC transporter substrate-binding protein [Candidatus Limnocylindrales bacterium]
MHWRMAWLAVSLLMVVGSLKLPQADARIVVGVSTVNVAFLPIYLTQDKGFFKDEGLDVLVVMFNAGATNLQAMIGGDVQIMAGGVPETVLARASGVDIKNFWAISNLMPFQIYGSPKLKSLKDGKGKKFAISRFGSLSEFLTRSALRRSGVDPKDVTMLQIGATPARFTTLATGIVDATILWFPVTERARAVGMNKLFDLKDIYPNWTNVGFIAREAWLAKEKDQAARFLRAYQRGVKHTRENRDDGIKALRKYVGLDAAEAAAGYDEYRDSFPLDGRILDAGISATVEQEIESGRLKGKISLSEMIDNSFINSMGKR